VFACDRSMVSQHLHAAVEAQRKAEQLIAKAHQLLADAESLLRDADRCLTRAIGQGIREIPQLDSGVRRTIVRGVASYSNRY
jgi:hypothetical protein